MGAWGDGVITFRDFGNGGSVLIKWNYEDSGALQKTNCIWVRVSEVNFDHSRLDFGASVAQHGQWFTYVQSYLNPHLFKSQDHTFFRICSCVKFVLGFSKCSDVW